MNIETGRKAYRIESIRRNREVKRFIVSLSMVMALILTVSAAFGESAVFKVNENFSIRNGVKYGMTKEQVRQIEDTNENTEFFEEQDEGKKISYQGNVVGVEGSQIWFVFKDGLFKTLQYRIGSTQDLEFAETLYNQLVGVLEKQYGAYYTSENESTKTVFAEEFNKYNWVNYREWIVEYNDIYAIVTLCNRKSNLSSWFSKKKYPDYYVPFVYYELYTKDEMSALFQQDAANAEYVEGQIQDEL